MSHYLQNHCFYQTFPALLRDFIAKFFANAFDTHCVQTAPSMINFHIEETGIKDFAVG